MTRGPRGVNSDQFLSFVNSEDDLTRVLRGHIALEAAVNSVLDRALGPLSPELDRLRFLARVDLAIALGKLDPESRPLFETVTRLRNRFAHQLTATLTREDAEDALARLPSWARHPPDVLDHPHGPAAAIGWCMNVLWSHAITRGLLDVVPALPTSAAERPQD